MKPHIARVALVAWAGPCSLVGLVLAGGVLLCGGRARRNAGTLEVWLHRSMSAQGWLLRALPFRAITLGHVIVAATPREMDRLRAHELVHVRQYERWGARFSSLPMRRPVFGSCCAGVDPLRRRWVPFGKLTEVKVGHNAGHEFPSCASMAGIAMSARINHNEEKP